jgi:transposase InsO family protein
MGIDSHLSTCVGTQSPKYLEMAQGHISLSLRPLLLTL